MSMLSLMPWCPIDQSYSVGEIDIIPFQRGDPIEGLDKTDSSRANSILGMYKTLEGKEITNASLVRFKGRSFIDDLTDDEIDMTHELVDIACFTALAKRQLFGRRENYCNSDCFNLRVQQFANDDSVSFSCKHRTGRWLDGGYRWKDITITVPMNCHLVSRVSIDPEQLIALLNFRTKDQEWGRWQNAISSFNQANSDNTSIQYQMDWVRLCSAFERLLDAKSNYEDVAVKFTESLTPKVEIKALSAKRKLETWKDKGQSLRREWMREFYRIRGDYAHGKAKVNQAMN
jgi:hypothetical protein